MSRSNSNKHAEEKMVRQKIRKNIIRGKEQKRHMPPGALQRTFPTVVCRPFGVRDSSHLSPRT